MSDTIIQPARETLVIRPTEEEVDISVTPPETKCKQMVDAAKATIKKEKDIKELDGILVMIRNTCDTLSEYSQFQQCINPETRALIKLSNWSALMFAIKSLVRNYIDTQYMKISEPPSDLSQRMENAYDSLEIVSENFTESTKEIIELIQSQLMISPKTHANVLESMTKDSKKTKSRLP